MFALVPLKRRRRIFSLQLTAMIDVFALIVIYLIKGTFFGSTDVNVPSDMRLPTSFSKENVETAPTVVISGGQVQLSMRPSKIALAAFDPKLREEKETRILRAELKGLVNKIPAHAVKSGVLLSVVADAATPYRDVFNVIRLMRESGFEAMLFIASGPEG